MTGTGADVGALVRRLVSDRVAHRRQPEQAARGAIPARPSRVTVVPVTIGGALRYRFTARQATRSSDENLAPEAAIERLTHLLEAEFRQGLLQSTEADWQVLVAGKEAKILRRPPSRPRRDARATIA